MIFKVCLKCGQRKLLLKFNVDKRNKDGRTSVCKACRGEQSLDWYYQNKERILIQIKNISLREIELNTLKITEKIISNILKKRQKNITGETGKGLKRGI